MRVAAFTWRIGGVVGAGVCEAVWWVVVEEEAAAEEAGEEVEGKGGVVAAAAATVLSERRLRPTLEALGVFEGGVVSTAQCRDGMEKV